MKLTVLIDNNTIIDRQYYGEPGLSLFLEEEDQHILFDVGYSSMFLHNAEAMGIDLRTITTVVLSHGHNDHVGGLPALAEFCIRENVRPKLIAHPKAFEKKWWKNKDESIEEIGMNVEKGILNQAFNVIKSSVPIPLSNHLVFLGEIPRHNLCGIKSVGLVENNGNMIPDFVEDDSAVVFTGTEGISIITGCSHSGILNVIDYAKEITGAQDINIILGGFHLLGDNKDTLGAISEGIASYSPQEVYPCHCTDLNAKIAINNSVSVNDVGVGTTIDF